jgi:hypothetical protein
MWRTYDWGVVEHHTHGVLQPLQMGRDGAPHAWYALATWVLGLMFVYLVVVPLS